MKKKTHNRLTRKIINALQRRQAVQAMASMSEYMNMNYRCRMKQITQRFISYIALIVITVMLIALVGNNLSRSVALPICSSLWIGLITGLFIIRYRFNMKQRYYEQQRDKVHERWLQQCSTL